MRRVLVPQGNDAQPLKSALCKGAARTVKAPRKLIGKHTGYQC